MFNRSQFNRAPFNRPFSVDILASFTWDGEGGMSIKGTGEFLAVISMHGEGEFSINAIREQFASINWDGVGELSIAAIRERLASIRWNGEGSFTVNANRYHIDEIEITGPFAPGDKIIIDSGKFRVTKNGQMIGYSGDFFDLHPGANHITYTDPATGRTIQMRVTYRDKYLY
jgi:hypothetical protein